MYAFIYGNALNRSHEYGCYGEAAGFRPVLRHTEAVCRASWPIIWTGKSNVMHGLGAELALSALVRSERLRQFCETVTYVVYRCVFLAIDNEQH